MKKAFIYGISVFFLFLLIAGANLRQNAEADIKALVIVPAYYGANINLLLDDCEQYGINVTTAGLTKQVNPCPWASNRSMPKLSVDSLIAEIKNIAAYDCLIFSYATWRYNDAFSDIMKDSCAMALIKKAADIGLVIYMPCSSARVLAKANLVAGRKITAVAQYGADITNAGGLYQGENIQPVTDGNFVSATRGMYYHVENFDALLAAIQKKRSLK